MMALLNRRKRDQNIGFELKCYFVFFLLLPINCLSVEFQTGVITGECGQTKAASVRIACSDSNESRLSASGIPQEF